MTTTSRRRVANPTAEAFDDVWNRTSDEVLEDLSVIDQLSGEAPDEESEEARMAYSGRTDDAAFEDAGHTEELFTENEVFGMPSEPAPDMVISQEEANKGEAEALLEDYDMSALSALDPTEDAEDMPTMVMSQEEADLGVSEAESEYVPESYGEEVAEAVPTTNMDLVEPYELDAPIFGGFELPESSPEDEAAVALEGNPAGDVAPTSAEALSDPTETPDDGASALGDPAPEFEDPEPAEQEDPALAMWDERIARLQSMMDRTQNATVRRVIGRLITSAIAGASRALGMKAGRGPGGRRSYEDPLSAPTAEEQALPGLIAEQGERWSNRDELRDRTALEAQRMRLQQGEAQREEEGAQFDRLAGKQRMVDQQASADRTRATMGREQDELDPASGRSQRARDAFRMSSATLPPDVQAAYADQMANLDNLSAQEVNELSEDIHHYAQGRIARRDGTPRRGGGGGGTPQAVVAAARARVAELQRYNIVDEETGNMLVTGMASPNPRHRREVEAQIDNLASRLPNRPTARMAADAGDGQLGDREIIPGVYSGLSGLEDREVVAIRRDYRQYRAAVGHLNAIADIVDRHGVRAFVDPRIRAEIQRRFPALRNMITNVQGTGIIQVSEMPLINEQLPDPTSVTQQTLQLWGPNLRSWIAQNNELALGTLEDYGVDGEGLQRAQQWLNARPGQADHAQRRRVPTPGAAPAQAPQGSGDSEVRVRVRSLETGRTGTMTEAQLAAASDRFERID